MGCIKAWLIHFFLVRHVALSFCPATVHKDVRGFGPLCKYRCNCKNNVQCHEVTGECPNGCLQGWMGPACQYRNLGATAFSAIQNPRQSDSVYFPINAVDLDETTCSKTGTGQGQRWLRISLSSQFYLVGFVLKLPNYLLGFSVEVGNRTDSWSLCFKHNITSDLSFETEVICETPLVGQYIQIKLAEEETKDLTLCEVEIYGGRLLSFNRDTTMMTTYSDGTPWSSSYGVDGKVSEVGVIEDNVTVRTCAATDYNPRVSDHWWKVDLLAVFSIQGIDFFGRQDKSGIQTQYKGFAVQYQLDNQDFVDIYNDTSNGLSSRAYQPKSYNFTLPVDSQVVRVIRYSVSILVVCELEIFGDCPYGTCGWECNETCMCNSQTTGAHKISGTCPDKCAKSWTGENRKCIKELPDENEEHVFTFTTGFVVGVAVLSVIIVIATTVNSVIFYKRSKRRKEKTSYFEASVNATRREDGAPTYDVIVSPSTQPAAVAYINLPLENRKTSARR